MYAMKLSFSLPKQEKYSLFCTSIIDLFYNSLSREATHRFRTSNNAKSNPEIKGRNSIFFRHDALQVSVHALFTSTPHVFLLNIFINKTERSIHFYWIHFLNKIVTWLTREYVYLWYRLLEINVGTRDTAADEML